MTELLTGAKQSSRITSRSWQGEELQLFDGGLNTPAPVAHQSARIFRPSRPVTTSARVTCRPWLLVFERRTPPVIDHLMGYCGGGDTLSQVELNFPTREAAVAFAERQELDYVVHTDPLERPRRNVRTFSLNGYPPDRLRRKSRVMGAAITGR
ncbi:NADH dehydrogenase ubiquinone Fe-S protein 4 [Mesorhizobium amorphae]|uniref:NADH dehydrogenase ubiquinone Fe-S protein 4 n=1 Tax=Mesorhizobium amorphae TaxID=71433 RepID=UPI001780C0C2|nr:NADH dehydrogenase ubiquinone Fe-S protein 4 [Mesorhizobium amorphae]